MARFSQLEAAWRKAGLAGMAQGLRKKGLLEGGVGGDDLLDRGQHGGPEVGGFMASARSCCPLAPSTATAARSALDRKSRSHPLPSRVGWQPMASTKIALSLVRHATASAQLVPSVLNLMPAYSLPVSLAGCRFSVRPTLPADGRFEVYRSHSPRRWMLKSMGHRRSHPPHWISCRQQASQGKAEQKGKTKSTVFLYCRWSSPRRPLNRRLFLRRINRRRKACG